MKIGRWFNQTKWFAVVGAGIILMWATAPAAAQDSVGACVGTSGLLCNDAQDMFSGTTEQAFVIDMGQYISSWGNWYGYAPIKAARNTDPIFFNDLISAQTTSMCMEIGALPRSDAYAFWQAQGFGVDNPQSMVTPPEGQLYGFGAAFGDYGGDSNNVISAFFQMSLANYNRFYVTRYESATNRANAIDGSNASIGIGGASSAGDPYFRADDNGAGGVSPITGNNWIYIDNQARTSGVVNDLNSNGGSNTATDAAATHYVLNESLVVHTPPYPVDCGAPTPLAAGGNFNDEYVYDDGTHAGTIATTAHNPGVGAQRGNFAYSHTFTMGSDGTPDAGVGAMLGKVGATTDTMAVFGVNADASVDGTKLLTLPQTSGGITDIIDGFNPFGFGNCTNNGEFDHYHSQVAFRGGNGQIALAGDANSDGILYAAATVYWSCFGNDDPYNYIAVARYDKNATPPNDVTWSIAAYDLPAAGDCSDMGLAAKEVLDGPGGNAIGALIPLDLVTGGNPSGPSMSAPMLDQDGNVYFIAEWEHYLDIDTDGFCDAVDPDSGLFKAHRTANGGYELELIISLGNTIYGPNSDTRYQFRFMGVADADSVSSGTAWSSNIVQDRLPGTLVNELDSFDSGGFVINVSVVYDVDKDGDYQRPSGATPDDANSPDEAYEEMIYVRGYVRTGACCLDGGSCMDTDFAFCNTNGGDFLGYGSVCEFSNCTPPPPPVVMAAESVGHHDDVVNTDLPIPLNVGTNSVEPRLIDAHGTRLYINVSMDQAMTAGPQSVTTNPAIAGVVATGDGSNVIRIDFAGAAPVDETCYSVDMAGSTAVGGGVEAAGTDFCICYNEADVDRSGSVNAGDKNTVTSSLNFFKPATVFPTADIDRSGVINTGDKNLILSALNFFHSPTPCP